MTATLISAHTPSLLPRAAAPGPPLSPVFAWSWDIRSRALHVAVTHSLQCRGLTRRVFRPVLSFGRRRKVRCRMWNWLTCGESLLDEWCIASKADENETHRDGNSLQAWDSGKWCSSDDQRFKFMKMNGILSQTMSEDGIHCARRRGIYFCKFSIHS